ncbi:MAG TPA: MFS transporter, partial [Nitrospirota bacterium]|nr:MFS transporter [Nitrospirota bacterium]
PVWGRLADRFRLHRVLLMSGSACIAAGAISFPLTSSLALGTGLALLSGIGLAASSTVANLFIVEARPRREWDDRIGWLQTFFGGGQVLGLVLAGLLGQSAPDKGMLLAGAVAGIAIIPAALETRQDAGFLESRRPVLFRSVHRTEWPVGSPQHLYHHPDLLRLATVLRRVESPFGLFLAAWLVSFAGSTAIFSLYPVLMQQLYGVEPARSAAVYAVAAGLGLVLYAPSGKWSEKKGPQSMLRYGLALRIAAFTVLTVLTLLPVPSRGPFAMTFFPVIVLAWSLLSVSSTALVAVLTPQNEGQGMGVFNAVTALSGVIGAAAGGWAASLWGYEAVPVLGGAGAAAGMAIMLKLFPAGPVRKKSEEAEP